MIHAPARRLIALAVMAAAAVSACAGGSTAAPITPSAAPTQAPSVVPPSQPAGGTPDSCPKSAPAPLAADATAKITLATEKGDIVIEVKGSLAPNATGNFVALAECGFYDGVVFHRLVPGFVIQGGDGEYGRKPNVDAANVGYGGPGYTIADDPVTTPYGRGTVAMARSAAPNSQGSQFFVVLDDQAKGALEQANTYAIMGTVVSGMEVVDTIAAMPNSGPPSNAALEPVAITKATVSRP
ncbi:MAG TPA: peptidylprolyl isomerase [Candidatus Nanopelagicales bacterium]|nr:peptidylprolyl isomerase [Candidatus Nanopelagicales bacterium]